MSDTYTLRLSLGPILYHWSHDEVFSFYRRMLDTPVDIIYLGESVCSKRRELKLEDYWQLAEEITAAGKQAVISTLALIESQGELNLLKHLCADKRFLVEANDLAAISLLEGHPFVAGHSINTYNNRTLAFLAKQGMSRIVVPIELGRDTIRELIHQGPTKLEYEIFSFGHLPLAYSARCFTAYNRDLSKDQCGFCCGEYPDGLMITTQDGLPFLNINGIQTQSAGTHNILGALPEIREMGVNIMRISPQHEHTEDIVQVFHDCIHGKLSTSEGNQKLAQWVNAGLVDGYWTGKAGIDSSLNSQTVNS